MSQRKARRMMRKMGMDIQNLAGVREVIIKTSSKEIVIDNPEVTLTQLQGQRIYQVAGGTVRDRKAEMEPEIIEEDVQLVAQKANVGSDDAREALKSTKGDLAQAILLLAQRRIGSK